MFKSGHPNCKRVIDLYELKITKDSFDYRRLQF